MRKFPKILQSFVKKIAKNQLFSQIFPNNLINHASLFRAFGRKTHVCEILRKLTKIFKKFLKKITKNAIILAYFSINLTNHALNFCGFRRKTPFIGKLEKNC